MLNPRLEIYSEPEFSIGDYDRILLDQGGLWHWEHNEFYPEYYVGQQRAEYENPTEPAYPLEHDPDQGAIVNSLCGYQHAPTFSELLDAASYSIYTLNCASLILNGSIIDHFNRLTAFVNPDKYLYSPHKSIHCELISSPPRAPRGYTHWLSLGYQESGLFAHVFYPASPTAQLNVLFHSFDEVKTIPWRHKERGLFRRIQYLITNSPGFAAPVREERNRFKARVEDALTTISNHSQ